MSQSAGWQLEDAPPELKAAALEVLTADSSEAPGQKAHIGVYSCDVVAEKGVHRVKVGEFDPETRRFEQEFCIRYDDVSRRLEYSPGNTSHHITPRLYDAVVELNPSYPSGSQASRSEPI